LGDADFISVFSQNFGTFKEQDVSELCSMPIVPISSENCLNAPISFLKVLASYA